MCTVCTDFFCPTRVNEQTRQMVDAVSYGFCPEHLIPEIEDCAENYDPVEDLCVRISPYPLAWQEAEDRCKSEGGHLLHILSEEVQLGVVSLIARKKAIKDFFTIDQWTTGLSSSTDKFWIGGTVLRYVYRECTVCTVRTLSSGKTTGGGLAA